MISAEELAQMTIAAEWGYRQCEKGKNLQATLEELRELLTLPFDEVIKKYKVSTLTVAGKEIPIDPVTP